jgi:hypothetical protein
MDRFEEVVRVRVVSDPAVENYVCFRTLIRAGREMKDARFDAERLAPLPSQLLART